MTSSFQFPQHATRPFEFFFVVKDDGATTRFTYSFPEPAHRITAKYPNILQFCFPEPKDCGRDMSGECFTFVLTDESGERTFGFVSRVVTGEACVLISRFAWSRVFSSLVYTYRANGFSRSVIEDFYNTSLPGPGEAFAETNVLRPRDDECFFIDTSPLELLDIFTTDQLFWIIAALMMESHVTIAGPTYAKTSRVCLSLLALLTPFEWQHVLIPVLPVELIEVLATPTPYLVGMLTSQLDRLENIAIERITVVRLGEDGKCEGINLWPEDRIPQRLPRTRFPSRLRMKLQSLKARKALTSRRLVAVFAEYYGELFGEAGSDAFDEAVITARYSSRNGAFFEAVFRSQAIYLLKLAMPVMLKQDKWATDPFLNAAVRAFPAVYPELHARLRSPSVLSWFAKGCDAPVYDRGPDDVPMAKTASFADIEMMDRTRSLSRAGSVSSM